MDPAPTSQFGKDVAPEPSVCQAACDTLAGLGEASGSTCGWCAHGPALGRAPAASTLPAALPGDNGQPHACNIPASPPLGPHLDARPRCPAATSETVRHVVLSALAPLMNNEAIMTRACTAILAVAGARRCAPSGPWPCPAVPLAVGSQRQAGARAALMLLRPQCAHGALTGGALVLVCRPWPMVRPALRRRHYKLHANSTACIRCRGARRERTPLCCATCA